MDLENRLIKLGSERKDLRPHIKPVLNHLRGTNKQAAEIDRRDYTEMRRTVQEMGDKLMAFHKAFGDLGHLLDHDRRLKKAYKELIRSHDNFRDLLSEVFAGGKSL